MEWQPIETAPKEQTGECGATGPYVLLANEHGVWVGAHQPRYISGFKPENPWTSMMLNSRHMPRHARLVPTHWMPLPNPPGA